MEREGVHYRFISEHDFTAMREKGEFLEWAKVHGNHYATPRKPVEEALATGRDAILEIDVQGATQVKRQMPDACLIFIESPTVADLQERLYRRRTEPDVEIERRMADAYEELRAKNAFDGVIVNAVVGDAVEEVLQLMDTIKRENP
jgi:guanylate kinase